MRTYGGPEGNLFQVLKAVPRDAEKIPGARGWDVRTARSRHRRGRETSLPARPKPPYPKASRAPPGHTGGVLACATITALEPHLSPKVQCSTGPFWAYELELAFDLLAEAGFSDIELMVTRDVRTQTPELPAQLAADRGLSIGSVHGPFLVFTKTVWGIDPLQKIRRGVEMCLALGASTLIVHPPHMWERRFARWVVEECAEYCAEQGVTVAVETMYPIWMAGRRVRAYRWLEPKDLFAACPWVAMDTSHLTVARQ